jgi:hypothetical protein
MQMSNLYILVFRDGDYIKIGKADGIHARIAVLQRVKPAMFATSPAASDPQSALRTLSHLTAAVRLHRTQDWPNCRLERFQIRHLFASSEDRPWRFAQGSALSPGAMLPA